MKNNVIRLTPNNYGHNNIINLIVNSKKIVNYQLCIVHCALCILFLCPGIITAQAPAGRTVSTIVADVLSQLPAGNQQAYNQLMKELGDTGGEGVKILVGMMNASGKGDNSAVEFALGGLAYYASGNEALKNKTEQAFVDVLDAINERETKAFIIRQLAIVGSDAGINKLSGYLTDEKLSSPAAKAIAYIGGESAAKVLQMALMKRSARSPEAERNIIQALGDVVPIEGTEDLLITMINASDANIKSAALRALSHTGSKKSLAGMAAAAAATGYKAEKTGANEAYVQLIKRVYEQGYTKEAAAAAQSLLKNATKSGFSQLRIAALEVIFATQADKVKTLKSALKDGDVAYRNAALRYASGYADKAMYTELFKMLPKAGNAEKVDVLFWIGNEAQDPDKKGILKTVETNIDKTSTQTIIQLLGNADYNVKQAAAFALGGIGEKEAIPALADLLKNEDAKITSLAKNELSSFEGDVSLSVAKVMNQASVEGKKVALELLSERKADAYFIAVLEQTKNPSAEVKNVAYDALKNVVSEKDFVVLCGMLETSEPYLIPLQQAVASSISLIAPEKRTEMITNRILQAGDAKKYLYYPVLTSTEDPAALEIIVKGINEESGVSRDAAFEALCAWKGLDAEEALYNICKNPSSQYREKAVDSYIALVSGVKMTDENRYTYLRKAMEVANTDAQKNRILRNIGRTGTYQAMLYAGEYIDQSALKENAARAVMEIALANKDYAGNEVKQLLKKVASALNNPDADYQRQAIAKHLEEIEHPEPFQLSDEEKKDGFVILFDGTNMDEWTGNLVDYTIENGCISLPAETKFGGNLYTKKEYSDFIYRFEFQLTPGANNGIGIRAPLKGDAAYVGMEIQVLDSEHPIYKELEDYQFHGSIYGIAPAKRGFLKPVGEWNVQEIIADGNKIKVTLNGTVILDCDIKEATAKGTMDKKEHPGLFNKSGHIGFLGHGSALKFRNIRIKELK